ncbi:hypothetical protein PPBDW_II0103 [Photobacterium kishitanii]|nr:hypothetical protein PPBDW_II0103 [Photobacterium kishitanii]
MWYLMIYIRKKYLNLTICLYPRLRDSIYTKKSNLVLVDYLH